MKNGYVGSHFESNITKLYSFSIYTCVANVNYMLHDSVGIIVL